MIDRFNITKPNASVRGFLDHGAILKLADRWAVGFLRRVGAFIRRAAQQSMRSRKAVSQPGQPPSAHTKRFKRSIRFEVGPERRSVVIGPMAAAVGETLEFGGVVQSRDRRGKRRTLRYRPRPFMGPAMIKGVEDIRKKAKDPLPRMWHESVR